MSGNSIGLLLFSCSVVSESLRPHGLQHPRLPCPSLSPRVCSDSRPLTQWCLPTISSSVTPFFSCLNLSQHQSLFQWVSSLHHVTKVIRASASASVLSMNIQDWFPLGLTGVTSLQSVQGTLKSLLQHHSKADFFWHSAFFIVQISNIHTYMTTGKNIALTR